MASPSPAAPVPTVDKDEQEVQAATGPQTEDAKEQKSEAEELVIDVGKSEEPPAPEEPPESVKSDHKEETEEGPDDKAEGSETIETVSEAPLKVEEAGSKAAVTKGASSGATQDSDSSATCSADEVDEPEGGDKGR